MESYQFSCSQLFACMCICMVFGPLSVQAPSWTPFCSISGSTLKTTSRRPPGLTFERGTRNASKALSWRLPGSTFEFGTRNTSKRASGDLLDLLLSPRPEMLQNNSWKHPGTTFEPETRNASKHSPGSFLKLLLSLKPEMLQNMLLEASWT